METLKNKITATAQTNVRDETNDPAYLALWKKLKALRDENTSVFLNLKDIAARFESLIKPLELEYTKGVYNQCDVLIEHYQKSSLDTAELSLLGLWITEHQSTLGEHPFAQHLPLEALYRRWQQVLTDGDTAIDKHLASFAASSHEKTQAKNDVYNDSAGNKHFSEQAPGTQQKESDSGAQDFDEQTINPHRKNHNKANTASTPGHRKASKELESVLSVEKIFRKLAHALHPDREQEEHKKIEKDQLMRLCLEARDSNDLAALLMLYEQHVDKIDSLLKDTDLSQLEILLKKEIAELQAERVQLQSSGTLQAQILERYRSDNASETDRRFADHEKKLKERLVFIEQQTAELQTQKGLLQALTKRREIELDRMVIRELTGGVAD